jgi:hypothetical protein
MGTPYPGPADSVDSVQIIIIEKDGTSELCSICAAHFFSYTLYLNNMPIVRAPANLDNIRTHLL